MRSACAFLLLWICVGCGPYRLTYQMPSHMDVVGIEEVQKMHSHGIGPLIVGGGGFFFIFQAISPALIDYTGPVEVAAVCPYGFAQVTQEHRFWHNATAAGISWVALVNWWHPSVVRWQCLPRPTAPPRSEPSA